jgi:hypothetical protein
MAVPRKFLAPWLTQTYLVTCVSMVHRKLFELTEGSEAPLDHRSIIADWLARIAECYCVTIERFTVSSDRLVILLSIDAEAVHALTDADLLERWNRLYPCDPSRSAKRQTLIEDPFKGPQVRASWHNLSNIMSRVSKGLTTLINRAEQTGGRLWETRYQAAVVTDAVVKECVDVMVAAGKIQQSQGREDATRRNEIPAVEAPLTTAMERSERDLQAAKICLQAKIGDLLPCPLVAGRSISLHQAFTDTKAAISAIANASAAFLQGLLDWICCPKQLFLGGQKSLLRFSERLLQHSIPVPKRLQRAIDEARLL